MHKLFDQDKIVADLKNRSIRGGLVTLCGQIINQLIQIATIMVLARLLSPNEFGMLAMVTSVMNFILLFKDLGLVEATVQRSHITHEQISTLFWINISVSLLLMFVVIAMAPLLVWYYHEPQLYWITITLSLGFIMGGLGVQHEALLRRNMQFRAIASREVFSTLGGGIVGTILAVFGYGVWSLVWMALTKNLIQSLSVWIACGWWPGLPKRRTGARSMLAFGGNLTLFNIFNYFARNLDQILIGRYLGAVPLALYSKAYGLLTLPLRQINGPIGNVAIPALSRVYDQQEIYRRYYLRIIKIIGYLSFPIISAMAVLSKEIVLIVLGSQWIEASSVFLLFALAAFGQAICNTTGWVFISLNQTKRMAIWGMIASPVMCLSFFAGIPWGIKGVATSYLIASIFLVYANLVYCYKRAPFKFRDILAALFQPAIISIVIVVSMSLARIISSSLSPLWIAVISFLSGLLSFGGILYSWKALRKEAFDILQMFMNAIKQKKIL